MVINVEHPTSRPASGFINKSLVGGPDTFVGILLAASDWLYFTGLSHADVPVSVASLLRRLSVVITFFAGAKFFHETNLARKSLALAAILAGVVLICLGG